LYYCSFIFWLIRQYRIKPVAEILKAKFHYAIAGSKLVRSWSATSFESASVMEFGFKGTFFVLSECGL